MTLSWNVLSRYITRHIRQINYIETHIQTPFFWLLETLSISDLRVGNEPVPTQLLSNEHFSFSLNSCSFFSLGTSSEKCHTQLSFVFPWRHVTMILPLPNHSAWEQLPKTCEMRFDFRSQNKFPSFFFFFCSSAFCVRWSLLNLYRMFVSCTTFDKCIWLKEREF